MVKKAPVGVPESDEVVTATLEGGDVAQATIPEGTQDEGQDTVQSQLELMKAQLEAQSKKYEKDIGTVKSSLQKRERDLAQTWQEKEATYKKQLDELRKQSMSETDRKSYEYDLALERAEELQRDVQEKDQLLAERTNFYAWKDRFINEWKVPADKLVLDQGVDELVASGMEFVDSKMKELPMKSVEQSKPAETATQPKTSKEPPETAKPVSGTTVSGVSPADYCMKHAGGDWDKLFQMFDQGRLNRQDFDELADFYNKEQP